MEGAFACPECGTEVSATSMGPGRQVRCAECSTLLEVPFFVRSQTRRRGRRPKWRGWAALAATLVIALVAALVIAHKVRSRANAELSARTTAARPGISRADAERRLAEAEALEATDPAEALARYPDLLAALTEAGGLADLHDRARAQQNRARARSAETDLEAARACAGTDPARSVSLCERAARTAAELPPGTRSGVPDAARALAGEIAGRIGVILEPVQGQFRLGSPQTYNADLHPRLAEVLRQRGYLPIAESSPFRDLSKEAAPFRLSVEVAEKQNEFYEQSKNRITQIDATVSLSGGSRLLWRVQMTARTQVPLPRIRLYEETRLAFAPVQKPEIERRYYENALDKLHEMLIQRLRDLPAK
jgi:hypothetical protein